MTRCPACGGPKNSYHSLCYVCERGDDDHYMTAEGNLRPIPTGVYKAVKQIQLKHSQVRRTL